MTVKRHAAMAATSSSVGSYSSPVGTAGTAALERMNSLPITAVRTHSKVRASKTTTKPMMCSNELTIGLLAKIGMLSL